MEIMKKSYILIFALLLFCSVIFAVPVKITEPHTRFNPWMGECVYFFTFGQCYVDPDYCSKEYGKNAMEDTLITIDTEKECIYSREEYHKYLELKETNATKTNESKKSSETKPSVQEKKGPFRFVVEETELITILPKGYDPDEDNLKYTFTQPLDKNGEWQTTYGDAGEYTSTVTASDGQLSSSKDVTIIVTKKEEAPTIESFTPAEEKLTIDENSKIDFSIVAKDKNNDDLKYSCKIDGKEISNENSCTYNAGYDASGQHTIELAVTDGSKTVSKKWAVTVKNVNRKPELKEISDIKVKETGTVKITPEITDPDGDDITYTISEPVGNDGIWKTTYDDAGEYNVEVTASDGTNEVSQSLKITVENVNRPPVIIDVRNEP